MRLATSWSFVWLQYLMRKDLSNRPRPADGPAAHSWGFTSLVLFNILGSLCLADPKNFKIDKWMNAASVYATLLWLSEHSTLSNMYVYFFPYWSFAQNSIVPYKITFPRLPCSRRFLSLSCNWRDTSRSQLRISGEILPSCSWRTWGSEHSRRLLTAPRTWS